MFAGAGHVNAGSSPISLFMQPCIATPEYLVKRFDFICQHHRAQESSNQRVLSMALAPIVVPDTNASSFAVPPLANDKICWDQLKAVLPYFPGGDGPCQFDQVYIGTIANLPVPAGMHIYIDAMTNTSYRENMRQRGLTIAHEFVGNVSQMAPNVKWDWYVTHEYSFEYAIYDGEGRITDGYADYIANFMKDMYAILPDRSYLWSPFFGVNAFSYSDDPTDVDSYPRLNGIMTETKRLFELIYSKVSGSIPACSSTATCPFWLVPQDLVGSYGVSKGNITKESFARWIQRMREWNAYPFQNLSVNVELFIHNWWQDPYNTNPYSYYDPDCLEIEERERYYVEEGIPLGPAYALGGWYSCNHPDLGWSCDQGWTMFNQFCYWKLHWRVNWTQADSQCRSWGGQLASVHSKAENDFILGLDTAGETVIWFGLANPFHYINPYYEDSGIKNGSILFQWTDNTPREYTNWAAGWPHPIGPAVNCREWVSTTDTMCFPSTDLTDAEKCGAIYPGNDGGRWANAGCSWIADAFVCKKRPNGYVWPMP